MSNKRFSKMRSDKKSSSVVHSIIESIVRNIVYAITHVISMSDSSESNSKNSKSSNKSSRSVSSGSSSTNSFSSFDNSNYHNGGNDGNGAQESLNDANYLNEIESQTSFNNKKLQKSAFRKYIGVRSIFNPLWCLYGLRLSVVLLSVFGVFMVISSSSITLISRNNSPWGKGLWQAGFCIAGFIAYFLLSRVVPTNFYRKNIGLIYIFAIAMQILTWIPGIRHEANGNAGWIKIGYISLQPAEITKLALCMWLPMALLIAAKRYKSIGFKAYFPVLIGLAFPVLLIVAGKDLGTALIVIFIAFVSFYIGGFPTKWLFVIAGLAIAGVLLMIVTSQNRMRRIFATFYGCDAKDIRGVCFQSIHAQYAIASGGFMGVGIGNSREKWNYLPYAHNDFIFAIIGEEMGFLGASIVIALYIVIGWCLIASALKARSRFISIVLVCIASWIVGQGLVNILVVVQILPVMGVPMPFVSAGGSSLVMCLAAIGVADSLMRENLRTLIVYNVPISGLKKSSLSKVASAKDSAR